MRRLIAVSTLVVILLVLAACSSSPSKTEANETVLVFAAASLTDVFLALQPGFEDDHPNLKLEFSFAGSGLLREQITQGAPADVFASADLPQMEALANEELLAGSASIFALNRMQIAVPADNPAGISSLADLEQSNVLVGLCARGVPCGDFAHEILEKAQVEANVATEEANVRALADKIALGELDAGLVYATDVMALAPMLTGIDIPLEFNVINEYPIAAIANTPHLSGAEAFVKYVTSAAAESTLRSFGFDVP